ncbi:CotO family spore coat protein [Halobacillus sp. A5]|uniref:CotO family spore coat protein n=1 Tax=Halobacillus sp. A5 TaxID=2880263 RepID=UPI0020A632A5|nr:spore coat CotO family protein [Halobacillus sp. A5]
MANKKQIAKPPILYITQPNLPPAEVSMQTSFRGESASKNPSLIEAELRLRNQSTLGGERNTATEEAPVSTKADQEENKEETFASRKDRRQRFRDMSLEEKVNYFVQLPSQLPKMKCEVVTSEETVKGYIQKYEEGMVHMKIFQKPFHKEMAFKEIESIRLIGF